MFHVPDFIDNPNLTIMRHARVCLIDCVGNCIFYCRVQKRADNSYATLSLSSLEPEG